MSNEALSLFRETISDIPDSVKLDIMLRFRTIKVPCEIRTCYGDICKIVNALRDYSNLLRKACEEWDLPGYHQLEKISEKFQAGIGYNYDKALEKCRKRQRRKSRNDDIGGEALMMAHLKANLAVETAIKQTAPVGEKSEAET